MAIPSEYSYLLETVDFLWRNTQIYAIASGKSMRYYSSSYNICYQPANECSFLSYNEQSSSFQESKMIATTVGSIHITDNGGTITVSYDNFKLNFWSEYNQKWIEWIEPDGTYGDYLEVPHTGSWKTSQTVDFRNFQTSFNSLSDACNYIYCNFKHCYIYYNNELWVNPNPPEPITSNGGGATHIAKVTGQLKDLSSNLSDILMVSGGGGGGLLVGETEYTGKEAGGISGSGDNSADQSTGNAFGQGESGTNVSGGGSGLYGGYKGTSSKSGGAGSGYIGNSLLSNKKMVGYNVPTSSAESTKTESVNDVSASAVSGKPKSGNGFARIKFLRESNWRCLTSIEINGTNCSLLQINDFSIIPNTYGGAATLIRRQSGIYTPSGVSDLGSEFAQPTISSGTIEKSTNYNNVIFRTTFGYNARAQSNFNQNEIIYNTNTVLMSHGFLLATEVNTRLYIGIALNDDEEYGCCYFVAQYPDRGWTTENYSGGDGEIGYLIYSIFGNS